MVDYFDGNAGGNNAAGTDGAATTNGTAQPTANGEDLGMEEISVSSSVDFVISTE